MEEKVIEAVNKLTRKYKNKIVAVGLFGSRARGEETPKSDYDFIVIVKNWEKSLDRRFKIYHTLFQVIKKDITLIDVNYDEAKALLNGELTLTSTMLNILYDCKIIYDPQGILNRLVLETRGLVKKLGLKRYRVGRSYGWDFVHEV